RAGRLLPKLLDFGLAKLIENTGAGGAVTVAEGVAPTNGAAAATETLSLRPRAPTDSDAGVTVTLRQGSDDTSAPLVSRGAGKTAPGAGALAVTPAQRSPGQGRGTSIAEGRGAQSGLAILS